MLQKDPVKSIFLERQDSSAINSKGQENLSLDLCLQPKVLGKTSLICARFGCKYVEQKR